MKALYICDSKDNWADIRNPLSANFAQVELSYATSGSEAMDLITTGSVFSIIIIDVAIKNEEPEELFENLLDLAGLRPIVFVGEIALIKSRVPQSIFDEHDSPHDTIVRPIVINDFLLKMEAAFGWLEKENFEQAIDELDRKELLPMRLRNFYLFKSIPYDVYLELSQTKFLKVIHKDVPYTHGAILRYNKKHIKYLYLKKDEYLKFLEDGIKEVSKILFIKNLKVKIAIPYQIKACLIIHQYLKTVGVTEQISTLINRMIEVSSEIFDNHPDQKKLIQNIPFFQGDFAEQSVMTNYMCIAILHGLGWSSDLSRKKLGLASILQDSTLSNEDMLKITSLEDPNLKMFTLTEQEEYRNHPKAAAEIASNFQGFSEAEFVIEQHHELPAGNGFPSGVSINRFTSHSCAFILASNYASRLAQTNKSEIDKQKVLNDLKRIYKQGNFKEPLLALEKVLKI